MGNERDYFYAFDIAGDSWITTLDNLPDDIYHAGAITYGQSKYLGETSLENIFVVAQIEDDVGKLFIYSFERDTGAQGEWEEEELDWEVGPGVSITFRPMDSIYFLPPPYYHLPVLVCGELYLALGNQSNRFYCLPFKKILSPPQMDKVFPPNDITLDMQKIFFKWEEDPTSPYYQLQVAKTPDFSSPIIDITTDKNIYIPEKIFKKGVYYWRTRSSNSLWSEIRRFTIHYDWIIKPDIPQPMDEGGSIAYHKYLGAESIYCFVGSGRDSFYCYSIHQGRWLRVAPTPRPQNPGSSITSCYQSTSDRYKRRLLAIFGRSSNIERHWYYDVRINRWRYDDSLPAILNSGASITFDWRDDIDNAYLVIGGNRDSFYWNPNPFLLEEIGEGPQSLSDKKIKILSNSKRITFSYSVEIPSYYEISVYNLYGKKDKRFI